MKNIYLAQPASSSENSVFLPYAAGCLAAYAFQFEEIKDNYSLGELIFLKEDVDAVSESLDNPYFVGFSSYMWNVDYNLFLADKIKSKWKNCIICFGGPQIPNDTEYLEKYDFIDILMHGEGEKTFYNLLKSFLIGCDLSEIPDISFRTETEIVKTQRSKTKDMFIDYPSPYEAGFFDSIINNEKYKEIKFDTVIESTRGCPYNCAYCSWGKEEKSLRFFPLDRVKKDLEWISKNRISYCMCADGNFGITDRDEGIVDFLLTLKKEYGYPKTFETASAKNKNDLIFNINKKLDEAGLNRGVSVSVQSMSKQVLKNIGRENLNTDSFSEQLKLYRKNNISTYTDIILGLPGETFESFTDGVFKVIEAGQHSLFNVNNLELLPNTLMYSKAFKEKFKIKTVSSGVYQSGSTSAFCAYSACRSDIVVETSSMPREQWQRTKLISSFVQAFHCMGLTRYISIYLRKAKNISYKNFYMDFYRWVNSHSVSIKKYLDKTDGIFASFSLGKSEMLYCSEKFGQIQWRLYAGMFLDMLLDIDSVYDEIKEYSKAYFEDMQMFDELIKYQKSAIMFPCKSGLRLDMQYDWHDYFENIFDSEYLVPEERKTSVQFKAADINDWFVYANRMRALRRDDKMIDRGIKL